MMKLALTTALLLTLGAGTGMAGALVLDFGALGNNSYDITSVYDVATGLTSGGWTDPNTGINLIYNIGGDALNGSAQVTSHGIDGFAAAGGNGLNGLLSITFPHLLAQGLLIDFYVNAPAVYSDGAAWTLDYGQTGTSATDANGIGQILVEDTIVGIAAPFSKVDIYFTANSSATDFNVGQVVGDVPEPGTYGLLGSGLLLLGFGGRKLIKRRS